MEVCVPCSESSCRDSSSRGGSLRNPQNAGFDNTTDISVSDLKACLNKILVEDGVDLNFFGDNEIVENKIKAKDKASNSASKLCLQKCVTFPLIREPKATVDGFFMKEKQEEGVIEAVSEVNASASCINQSCSRSISLPTAPKLLSALKGSREKHGIQQPKKLSITWAPDVYDPIPSSVSHVPSSKNQRYRSDGKRKNKQKRSSSKSSRGSKDREKKQTRKTIGTSYNKLKPILSEDNRITTAAFAKHASDFAVGNPSPSCGSSLMKDSVTKLHYSVAEAS